MGDFGIVGPDYAMAAAMTQFGRIQPPKQPRTVYNVGVVEGGTSVNSIPFATSMAVDMRSAGNAALDAEERDFLAIQPRAVAAENAARSTANDQTAVEARLIGDRPVGEAAVTAPIVATAAGVVAAGGVAPSFGTGSSDSNIPWSMARSTATPGSGLETHNAHALDEYLVLDRPRDVRNMSLGLATLLLLAGAS